MPYKDIEERRKHNREYQQTHKEQHNQSSKKHYASEKGKISHAKYGKSDKCRTWHREYRKERSKKDLNFRMKTNLRCRMNTALKVNQKSGNTIDLLGCSIDEYKIHLQSKFTPEMNWQNYGNYWEIDHIIPCNRFDLSDPEQQKICFNFSNTQPLEKSRNRSKGDK